jgi:hypothetical protein
LRVLKALAKASPITQLRLPKAAAIRILEHQFAESGGLCKEVANRDGLARLQQNLEIFPLALHRGDVATLCVNDNYAWSRDISRFLRNFPHLSRGFVDDFYNHLQLLPDNTIGVTATEGAALVTRVYDDCIWQARFVHLRYGDSISTV